MTYVGDQANDNKPIAATPTDWLKSTAVWAFIAVLAWSPFPLGGAVSWGAGLQELLIAACWLLWLAGNYSNPASLLPKQPAVLAALLLASVVLVWALLQTLPVVPLRWAHPIWQVASEGLGRPVAATISMNPWRTEAELLKLFSSVAACWLAYSMSQRAETARLLFNAIIVIGALYAVYGFVLIFAGMTQAELIYQVPIASTFVTGPFMLHNSFATYVGLATLAAVAKLFDAGSETIVSKRGARQLAITLIQYAFGRGALLVVGVAVLFAAVVASASRGGFAATSVGLAAMALLMVFVTFRSSARIWPALGILAAITPIFVTIVASGGQLGDRVDQLLDAGTADSIRLALWAAAEHMISDAPWRGLGLGTFQDAYPLYASQVFPFVMDKAHCDYLEFAAGLGIPAATLWWLSMATMGFLAARGAVIRRRNRLYALTAAGATVLVAVHSSADFSLQMPAVALSYAALLGVGVAQSLRTAKN